MAKYYIESKEVKQIVDCDDKKKACMKAINMSAKEMGKAPKIGMIFFISEYGFISDREGENRTIHDSDYILATQRFLGQL